MREREREREPLRRISIVAVTTSPTLERRVKTGAAAAARRWDDCEDFQHVVKRMIYEGTPIRW